jgi:hypothetical protein
MLLLLVGIAIETAPIPSGIVQIPIDYVHAHSMKEIKELLAIWRLFG